MATASAIHVQKAELPVYYRRDLNDESAKKVSHLLQENHDNYHIFFNASGFHNHIAHHLLTIWALRGTPPELQQAYDVNKTYQRHPVHLDRSVVGELHDPKKFLEYLGPEKYYQDFLVFFQQEIEKTSVEAVLQKYVFAGDKRAETMFVRLFAGFLHPIIHLGFGIEFRQPAIIAEALAQTACHDDWIGRLLLPAEKAAKEKSTQKSKSIVSLLDEIHADPTLRSAPHWSDGNKIRDGLLVRGGNKMIDIASQVHVTPDNLTEKVAEMTNAVAYYTAGAQRRDKAVKFDFYFMHCVNSSIFFPAFLALPWLSEALKIRLLEWKIRMDLAMYASRKSPDVRMDEVRNYKPKKPSGWDEIQDRACVLEDDGHASKLVRALAHGQQISKPYESSDAFRVKQDDWLQMGHMAIDSVELPGANWVRSAGFDEAWEEVPVRAQL